MTQPRRGMEERLLLRTGVPSADDTGKTGWVLCFGQAWGETVKNTVTPHQRVPMLMDAAN